MRTKDFQDFPRLIFAQPPPPFSQNAIPSLSYFRQPFPPGQRSEEPISQSLYFSSRRGVQLVLLILITLGSDMKESEIDGILKNSLPGLERWLKEYTAFAEDQSGPEWSSQHPHCSLKLQLTSVHRIHQTRNCSGFHRCACAHVCTCVFTCACTLTHVHAHTS